jgi:RNA polymerase sigma factor (sigma-70 family)
VQHPDLIHPLVRAFMKKRRRKLVSHLGSDPGRMDDLAQELQIALWQAAKRFDTERGDFGAFAESVLDRHVAKFLRHRFARKRSPAKERSSDSAWRCLPNAHAARVQKQTELAMDLASILDGLPPEDRRVAELLSQERAKTTERLLGLTRARLDTARRRLRRRFEDAGLRHYL